MNAAGHVFANLFRIGSVTSPIAVNDGNFHHVAVTYDGTTETLYVDGLKMASETGTETGYGSSAYQYQLGTGYIASSWYTFHGLIDEATLYSRALAPNEVLNLFAAGAYGKCDPAASL